MKFVNFSSNAFSDGAYLTEIGVHRATVQKYKEMADRNPPNVAT